VPPDLDVARRWLAALDARYRRDLTTSEFLRAVRALSARYVETRHQLDRRPAIDSRGKRAAFAAFYAPLHYFTVAAIIDALGAATPALDGLLDLGCGTGAASAAWASAMRGTRIIGIDRDRWMPAEARGTWRHFGLRGTARTGDLVRALAEVSPTRRPPSAPRRGVLLAWTVNELDRDARHRALEGLTRLSHTGTAVLVVEPIARAVVPWWPAWQEAFIARGGRADEWRFPAALPSALVETSRAAGFNREALTARTLFLAAQGS